MPNYYPEHLLLFWRFDKPIILSGKFTFTSAYVIYEWTLAA